MSKHLICLLFVSLGLVPILSSQEIVTGAFSQPATASAVFVGRTEFPAAPPSYCNPCIFYSGDFDLNKSPNGLLNGLFPQDRDATVWIPFSVGSKIQIQGLFVNELFDADPPLVAPATWEIRSGITEGQGGTVQCSGAGTATATKTGRTFTFAGTFYREWTYLLLLARTDYCQLTKSGPASSEDLPVNLPDGGKGQCPPNCYMSMTVGNSATDAETTTSNAYLSDIPLSQPKHHFGSANVNDNSFVTSSFYNYNFAPAVTVCATGPPLAITRVGCHMFSVGLIGTGN